MAAARPCKLLLALAAAAQATTWGGLRNQGNTCYLNSLLQTLFHVPALRSDVLGRPAEPRGVLARLRTAPRPARALADVFKRLAQNATAHWVTNLAHDKGRRICRISRRRLAFRASASSARQNKWEQAKPVL